MADASSKFFAFYKRPLPDGTIKYEINDGGGFREVTKETYDSYWDRSATKRAAGTGDR